MERTELVDLVKKIMSVDGKTESEINELVVILSQNVPHPAVSDLIYFDTLTPEEIIDKALSYKPIQL